MVGLQMVNDSQEPLNVERYPSSFLGNVNGPCRLRKASRVGAVGLMTLDFRVAAREKSASQRRKAGEKVPKI